MRGIGGIHPGWGITAVRVVMGIILAVAGYNKFFQFGVTTGVTATMTKFGLPAPAAFAWAAAIIELFGGLALIIGLFGRWVGLLVAIEFAVATFFVQFPLGGFPAGRLELLLLAGGLLLFLAGPGRAAVDEVWLERR
jgi:putative oxidoreductase